MKIFHKGKDISTLVKKITWSGSRMQVARKLVFDYVQDDRYTLIPVLEINNGETIFGYDEENNIVFRGNVFDVEKNRQNSNVRITAFDNLFILSKSKTTKKFVNITDLQGGIPDLPGLLAEDGPEQALLGGQVGLALAVRAVVF